MAKIIIEIDKEGNVNIDSTYTGKSCKNSKVYMIIENKLKQDGEIDKVELKYEENQIENQMKTIEIQNLI